MPGNNRNRRNNRNRKKRKQYGFYFDYTLLFVLVFIVGFGLTMIYSTSSYTAQIEEGDPEFYFRKQLIFTIIGFALMIVETKILDYHYLKNLAVVIYIGGLLCMFLLKTPLGITRNGATRWIKIPGLVQFQPAELVKIGTIAMTAFLIVKAGQNIKKFRTVIVICIIAGFAPALLVYVLSSNMSSALIVALISVVMTFVAYPGYKIYVALTGLAAVAFGAFYSWIKKMAASGNMTGKFRLNRILVWLNPEEYIDDKNTTFIANGESGRVVKILKDAMVVDYDGTLIYIPKSSMKNIRLAYAISTHKSQGGQFKVVVLITPKAHTFMLNSNLLYVGESRAKEKCYHLGEIRTVNNALKKKENFDRKTMLQIFMKAE